MNRVLVCEPSLELGNTLRSALERRLIWAIHCVDQTQALEVLKSQYFHACIWPVFDESSVGAIAQIKSLRPSTAVIAVGDSDNVPLVVASIRAGAANYWKRETDLGNFLDTLSDTLAKVVPDAVDMEGFSFPVPNFIGRHPAMVDIFRTILSIKDSDSTVLITGESGTGKEVVARAIHDLSPRRKLPLVAINCGAIPANLLESELFGHVKGAFTGALQNRLGRFQLAGSGTLFLDEIGDLPLDLQGKILRALQNRTFEPVGSAQTVSLEARIIAATNQDLESAVAEKRFRQDLFYRLNVIPIHIAPLRARKSDIPLLVKAFMEKFSKQMGKSIQGISEEAMRMLMQYHWPGNIRELENLIERVVVLKQMGNIIELKDFPVQHFSNVRLDRFVSNVAIPDDGIDFNQAVNEFENELILQALQRASGNKNRAATLLNLNRTTLVEKLKRKGLTITN